MKKIHFTVIIPVFNTNPGHLMEAVDSICNQRNVTDPFDIILVDDGSTLEGTKDMLKYLNNNYGKVILHTLKENRGTSSALNEGHKLIETEYVAIMGSDDISHPDRFQKQIAYLGTNPTIDVLGTQLQGFKNEDIFRKRLFGPTTHAMRPNKILDGWIVNHGTVMYKHSAVMECGGYNLAFKRGQDVDLWKRMFAKGKRFANLQECLYAWRRF